jgi:hypothetical protein
MSVAGGVQFLVLNLETPYSLNYNVIARVCSWNSRADDLEREANEKQLTAIGGQGWR